MYKYSTSVFFWLGCLGLLVFSACGKNIIPQSTMAKMMWEMQKESEATNHIAMFNGLDSASIYRLNETAIHRILKKYNTSKDDFNQSLDTYKEDPALFLGLISEVQYIAEESLKKGTTPNKN